MERIAIISRANRMHGGMTFLYPIFRWERQLKENGLQFDILSDHKDSRILNYKVVIIIHRYFELMINQKIIPNREPVKEFLEKLKDRGIKVIFFDAGDSTGSWFFDMMDHVSLFLKKQLFLDKERYLVNEGAKSVRAWMTEYDDQTKNAYHPCKKENLNKLQLAWNIGLVDFRNNPYRIGLISNYFFTKLKTIPPSVNRKILTTYRGNIHNHNAYAYQRNALIKLLLETQLPVITGEPINRKKYLKELASSKAIVSPFGWGEICYRDFEAFINGAILIKPDMSHLETFPNFYQPSKTYLPLNWQMTDLEEKLNIVNDRYEELIEMANYGQQAFRNFYDDADLFVNHVKEIISRVE